jgi:probable rRNA maturation factor
MITVNTQIDPAYQPQIKIDQLTVIVKDTLKSCQVHQAGLTVVITSDEAVQALNHTYRNVAAPTDVLSFEANAEQDGFVMPKEDAAYLGDVIISLPAATRQAEAAGHRPMEEILLLAVHGTLHLLGFDHLTDAEKDEMWRVQQAILRKHNLSHVRPTE